MEQSDPVLHMIDALSALEIPFMLVGSYSSMRYGILRSTKDADFVVEMADRPVTPLGELVKEHWKLEAQLGFETVTGRSRWRFHHSSGTFTIELFILPEDEYDRVRFSRRVAVSLFGRTIWYQSAEDVIIIKLRWKRTKDLADVEDVMKVSGQSLDWHYIEHWCERFGTMDLLRQKREELRAGGFMV